LISYTDTTAWLQDSLDSRVPASDLFSVRLEKLNVTFSEGEAGEIARSKEKTMDLLMTIGIVLLILWLMGLVTSYTLGGFIHILLVLAIIVILVRVIQGRRPIP
jgi:Family of unknown function (DUF5670)